MPGKHPITNLLQPYNPTCHPPAQFHSPASSSSPDRSENLTISGGSYSAVSSNSDHDNSSSTGAAGLDLLDYMHDRLSSTIDPMPLDRGLATQAQVYVILALNSFLLQSASVTQPWIRWANVNHRSGEMNAKTRELLELQALAKARLRSTKANFADGVRAAKEVQKDLEWTQKRVT